METPQPVTRLWFSRDARAEAISAQLRLHAATLEFLCFDCDAVFAQDDFFDLRFPKLRDLAIGSFTPIDNQKAFHWLSSLKSLQRLQVARAKLTEELLRSLRNTPWFPELIYLELAGVQVADEHAWAKLWQAKPLALRTLCMHYVKQTEAVAVLHGDLPELEYLILGGTVTDAFATDLAQANLPKLADLELRHLSLSGDAVRTFLKAPQPGLPQLARIGWRYDSDRREDYTDWNGALVGWGYESMSAAELRKEFFTGTGLDLLPQPDDLERKFLYEHARHVFGTFVTRPR